MVVHDLIRLRMASWELAHEVMLVMFKRVEDSDGRLHLGNIYDEVYLTSIMDEARQSVAAFFRSGGGNLRERDVTPSPAGGAKSWNGKFTASSTRPCPHFNMESAAGSRKSSAHPAGALILF